jgi:hypothetical protein
MKYGTSAKWMVVPVLAAAALQTANAQQYGAAPQRQGQSQFRQQSQQATPQARQHPLEPAIQMAKRGLADIEKIRDYECTLVKREMVKGKLSGYEYVYTRVRHRPFSVYMYFLSPSGKKGQQALYIQGRNDGKLTAKPVGIIQGRIGQISLDPKGWAAMRDNRYPITEVGVKNLAKRLIEVAEHDKQFGECSVKFYNNTKVNNRITTCIEVTHPVPRKTFRFNVARIFIDDQTHVPIRYESYTWPQQRGGQPVLQEEYTYLNMKLNNGFTDADFVIRQK